MRKENVNRLFFQYVIPSVLSFALSGVYTIVDGFFIGNRLGDIGIAAITLGYPVTALIQAVGSGLGLAGAIRYTILSSQGDSGRAQHCLGGAVLLMLVSGTAVTAGVLIFLRPLMGLLGAEGSVLGPTEEYVRFIVLGAIFQIMGTGLVPFIRNMGGSGFAMTAMLSGFGANIVFDWLFVWVLPYGMAGAAWASVLGQALTMLLAIGFFVRRREPFRIPAAGELGKFCRDSVKVAIAPFGLVISPNITLLFMNRFLLVHGGERALAAYGCIGYIVFIVLLLLQGVGDGSQPLVSRFYGEGERESMLHTRRLSFLTGFVIALVSFFITWLYRDSAGLIFGASPGTNSDVARILPLFMAALPLEAYTRAISSYLYATEKSGLSYALVYSEPTLVLLFLFVLAPLLGLTGVWLANPLARLTAAAAALIIKTANDKKTISHGGI